jgi:uncharacterized protein (TIGR03083 family)
LDKADIVADLDEVWSRLLEVGEEIAESKWSNATSCPGWSIKDNFAHVIGTELSLLGMATPNSDQIDRSIVKNPIGEMNQQWIESMRGWSKREVLDKLAWVAEERKAAIEKMDQEEFMKLGPSPVGEAPYARFMQIRIFDCYMHEQDIRVAVGRPGHEDGPVADAALREVVLALGYIVGKRVGAPDGSRVTIALTGPIERQLHVAVDGRATLVAALDGPPTAAIALSSTLFLRLAGGRLDPASVRDQIRRQGDPTLAERLATNLAYTI